MSTAFLYGHLEHKTNHSLLEPQYCGKQSIVAASVFSKAVSGNILHFGEIRLLVSVGIFYMVHFIRKGFENQQEKS